MEYDFRSRQFHVEHRMRRGDRFDDVEDEINEMDFDEEYKSALWLLAWSYVHPNLQRRFARQHGALLDGFYAPTMRV